MKMMLLAVAAALPLLGVATVAQPELRIHREASSTVTLAFAETGLPTVDLGTMSGAIRLTSLRHVADDAMTDKAVRAHAKWGLQQIG